MPIENATEAGASSTVPSAEMTVGETGYDVSAMMESSLAETDAEEASISEAGDISDGDEQPKAISDEDSDDDYDDEDSDGSEGESETIEDGIKVKVGDKEMTVSKDGEVEIKVNGKTETISIQEALNRASGGIHIERETARLGRERKDFDNDKQSFNKEAAQVNANAEALLEMQDPYELCEYICELKGGDPVKMFDEMIANTVKHLNRYKDMTPRERELENENRKFKRAEKARSAETKATQSQQETVAKREEVETSLTENGFTMDDFSATLDDLNDLVREGKEVGYGFDSLEAPTEEDIINYMIAKDIDNRVISGIESISPKLKDDVEFVNKVKGAIIKTEALHGKMSSAEVNTFLKQALKLDNKALSENLSKKVDTSTKSKLVNSHEQEDDADEGFDTLDDLYEASRKRASW